LDDEMDAPDPASISSPINEKRGCLFPFFPFFPFPFVPFGMRKAS
jgi:hypothetical protein